MKNEILILNKSHWYGKSAAWNALHCFLRQMVSHARRWIQRSFSLAQFNYLANLIISQTYGSFLLYYTWLFTPGPEIQTRLLDYRGCALQITESIALSYEIWHILAKEFAKLRVCARTRSSDRRLLYFYHTFALLYASQAANAGQPTKTRAYSMKSACFLQISNYKTFMLDDVGFFSPEKAGWQLFERRYITTSYPRTYLAISYRIRQPT